MVSKHKHDILREMLHTTHVIDIDDISLHSSDGSDIMGSTDKKLSEIEENVKNQMSRSSITFSKISLGENQEDDIGYLQSNIKNEYCKQNKKTIIVESADDQVPNNVILNIAKIKKNDRNNNNENTVIPVG